MKTNARIAGAAGPAPAGFTLIELLVVIAAIAVLAALLLPSLGWANQHAGGDQCMSNLKQLSQAWLMYNGDNRGNFVLNGGESYQPFGPTDPGLLPGGLVSQWCPGRQDVISDLSAAGSGHNVGELYIQAGLIYPYVKNALVYACPADYSGLSAFGVYYPHVRTTSMNAWLNPLGGHWTSAPDDGDLRVYLKESDLTVHGPVNTFIFVDEARGSINDGFMVADPSYIPYPSTGGSLGEWVDGPAAYHNNAAGISFTDGHAQIKKWTDRVILNNQADWSSPIPAANGADCAWLCNRSTARKEVTSFLGPQ